MKKYNITVNGTTYEVVVEEAGTVASAPVYTAPVAPATPAPAAAPALAPKAAPKAATPASAGAITITAPMPGTILDVKVSVGQTIQKGDVVCVLEAMKMENDICAPADGTVASVEVAQGATVETDAVLVTLN